MTTTPARPTPPYWLIPTLTGVIGLLLGAGIALAIAFGVQAANQNGSQPKGATSEQVAAADKKYDRALFDCSLDESAALRIDVKVGTLAALTAPVDGSSASGLAASSVHCVIQSLGASGSLLERIDSATSGSSSAPSSSRGAIGKLTVQWVSQSDGAVALVVSPTPRA